jgi:hypothetical protein
MSRGSPGVKIRSVVMFFRSPGARTCFGSRFGPTNSRVIPNGGGPLCQKPIEPSLCWLAEIFSDSSRLYSPAIVRLSAFSKSEIVLLSFSVPHNNEQRCRIACRDIRSELIHQYPETSPNGLRHTPGFDRNRPGRTEQGGRCCSPARFLIVVPLFPSSTNERTIPMLCAAAYSAIAAA